VRPGQRVPGGLHVKMNLETGKKEAKLLEQDKDKGLWQDGGLNHEALKEAMKNIKADDNSEGKTEFDPEKFRSMDELKEALGDVQMNMKTDMELLTKLVKEFKESTDDVDKVTILEDLEYYVHQYDNALLFVDMGGLKHVVTPGLNSTNPQMRLTSCLLLSGAAQSNPKFQISALEAGLAETLLRMTTLDRDPSVSTKAFSALSAIIRNFPEAQNTLLRQGGLGVLVKLFNNEDKSYERLKIKILTLISDLLIEREAVSDSEDETSIRRKSQYEDIDEKFSLNSQIREHGWCSVFSKTLVLPRNDRQAKRDDLLSTISEDFPLRMEHDIIEKLLGSMQSILPVCVSRPQDYHRLAGLGDDLVTKLGALRSQYQVLSDKERAEPEPDLYFTHILETISSVSSFLHSTKEEL